MRVIVAGSRSIQDAGLVARAIAASGFDVKEVVCGMADGVDLLGKRWAEERGIPVALYPADWKTYGRRAGYVRNGVMRDNADALVAVWDNSSRGTRHMVAIAHQSGLPVYLARTGRDSADLGDLI